MALDQARSQGVTKLPIPHDWEAYNLAVLYRLTKTATSEIVARVIPRPMADKFAEHASS
jgi:hypothetical protein